MDITTGKFRYFSATRAPLFNKDEEVIAILGTSIEITEQKEAELLKLDIRKHFLDKMTKIGLTKRELDCAILIVRGFNRKMIAVELDISLRTLECHVNRLKEKTNQYSQDALIRYLHKYANINI